LILKASGVGFVSLLSRDQNQEKEKEKEKLVKEFWPWHVRSYE
jgi:hypothetical protein